MVAYPRTGLTKAEEDRIIIRQKDEAHAKCADLIHAFIACCKGKGLLVPIQCGVESGDMRKCLAKYSSPEAFDLEKIEHIATINRKHEEYMKIQAEVDELKKQREQRHQEQEKATEQQSC